MPAQLEWPDLLMDQDNKEINNELAELIKGWDNFLDFLEGEQELSD
jgi:hypothetical protein